MKKRFLFLIIDIFIMLLAIFISLRSFLPSDIYGIGAAWYIIFTFIKVVLFIILFIIFFIKFVINKLQKYNIYKTTNPDSVDIVEIEKNANKIKNTGYKALIIINFAISITLIFIFVLHTIALAGV